MPLVARLSSLVRNILQRQRVERDLDDEVRSYLQMLIDEKQRAGLSYAEARRSALIELQGLEQVKECVRQGRAGATVEQFVQDLSYGARVLLKHRGFAATTLATLALGIGGITAVFTIVDTVVFRSLPYKDPARLVKISTNAAHPADDVSLPDFLDVRQQNHVFEEMAADDGTGFTVVHGGAREEVNGAIVTVGWLSTLGVRPVLGRGFLEEEAQPGRDRVMILTHAYWRRRFQSNPHVLGETLTVDGQPFTVVGVLPQNVLRYQADFLKPLVPSEYPAERGHRDLDVFARLRPGITVAQARLDVDTIAARLQHEYPVTNRGRGLSVVPLDRYYAAIQPKARQGLVLMLAAVTLVLLIACANVANLMLARAIVRSRECVIRAALGATRMRLVRQLLVENVLLFVAGGALGILIARGAVGSLLALAIAEGYVPERLAVTVDGRVLAFSVIVSLLMGGLFGLAVAVRASRVDLNGGLRDSSHTASGSLRRGRATRVMIVSELVLSLVLLVSFSLLARSFLRLHESAAGFVPDNVLETGTEGGRSFAGAVAFWQSALEQARAIPGVQFAAVTSRPPVHSARQQSFALQGHGVTDDEEPRAGDILVSPDYFRALGIPLLKGRAFTEHDTASAAPVAIISETLARRYFGGEDPIGRRLVVKEHAPMTCCAAGGPVDGTWREIVGVVGDVRQGNLDEERAATLYRPYSQIVEHDMYLMVRVRSSFDIAPVAASLGERLPPADGAARWWDVRPMRQVIDDSESIRLRRFVLILLGGFAGLALMLAAIGVYGVVAYSVAERRREIGIRMALGATRSIILTQVLAQSLRMCLAGLAIGGAAAFVLTRFISSMLFDIRATDTFTYTSVSVLLVSVALLASYLPARRAARVDPILALREP
jgi:predicted permease